MKPIKKFKVIDPNVGFIAGRRVPDSRIVEMTEDAARYDVQGGVLVPLDDSKPPRQRAGSGIQTVVED